MANSTLIFGHRGFPKKFPENSLEGFYYCLKKGIDGLEFDVHLTKDNIPVIIHDEKINRTTNGRGKIRSYDYNELEKFSLKNGEKIPTLKDFLKIIENKPVHLNLEFKTNHFHYPRIEQIVLKLINRTNLIYPVVYSSFNLNSLKIAQSIEKESEYCFLSGKKIKNIGNFSIKNHLSGFHLKKYQIIKNQKLSERVWTVNNPKKQRKLFSKKINGLITDDFEMAQKIKQTFFALAA